MRSNLLRKRLDEYLDESLRKGRSDLRTSISVSQGDLERIAMIAAEKTVASLAKGLIKELEKLREDIEELKRNLEELRREVLLVRDLVRAQSIKRVAASKNERLLTEIKDRINRYGYLLASELKNELGLSNLSIEKITKILEGVETIKTSSDLIIISKESFNEFKKRIKNIKTSDPLEASRLLGKFGKLFLNLRKDGLIIYNSKGEWRLLES
jgi:prefoldin subunit 5